MLNEKATERLYDDAPYLSEFEARVLSCEPCGDLYKIRLDRTAFFPESGGQYADTGTLSLKEGSDDPSKRAQLKDVRLEGEEIFHYADRAFKCGDLVCGRLDAESRYIKMQNHSGEHIVSGLVKSLFGFENRGFHLGHDDVSCDYSGELSEADIKKIELLANAAIYKNIEIECFCPSEEEFLRESFRSKNREKGRVRLVRIGDIDLCACCAPHVRRTGEIGLIKIVNHERHRGGTRLHLRCGALALADYDEKQENITEISRLLSARQEETAAEVKRLSDENARLSRELSRYSETLARLRLEGLDRKEGNLVIILENADTETLRALANGGREKCTGVFVALSESEKGFRYVITGNDIPLSGLAREFNELLCGAGGGRDDMISGIYATNADVIENFFEGWSYGG